MYIHLTCMSLCGVPPAPEYHLFFTNRLMWCDSDGTLWYYMIVSFRSAWCFGEKMHILKLSKPAAFII